MATKDSVEWAKLWLEERGGRTTPDESDIKALAVLLDQARRDERIKACLISYGRQLDEIIFLHKQQRT